MKGDVETGSEEQAWAELEGEEKQNKKAYPVSHSVAIMRKVTIVSSSWCLCPLVHSTYCRNPYEVNICGAETYLAYVSWDLVINRPYLLPHPALLCPAFPKINLEYCGSNMTDVLFLEFRHTYENKENAVRTCGRSLGHASISQGMPKIANKLPELRTGTWNRFSQQTEGTNSADALILDNKLLLLSKPSF